MFGMSGMNKGFDYFKILKYELKFNPLTPLGVIRLNATTWSYSILCHTNNICISGNMLEIFKSNICFNYLFVLLYAQNSIWKHFKPRFILQEIMMKIYFYVLHFRFLDYKSFFWIQFLDFRWAELLHCLLEATPTKIVDCFIHNFKIRTNHNI